MKQNKKGAIVFDDTMMSLIIGVVVVIMIVTGTAFSWNNLLCYTGAKWILESPAAHAGTAANSKVDIESVELIDRTYSECTQVCSDNYADCLVNPTQADEGETVPTCSELKSSCESACASDYDKSNPDKVYSFFSINIEYNGASASRVNVSVVQTSKIIWYGETKKLERGNSQSITTDTFSKSIGSCSYMFRARPMDAVVASGTLIEDKDFCLS